MYTLRTAILFMSLAVTCCQAGLALAQTPQQPELYALVVGVTKYEKKELNGLRFPEKDAEAVAAELKSLGYTEVDLLLGPAATKAAIAAKLAQFSKRGGSGGIVFVFLSGHGTEMEVNGASTSFFSPYDTEMKALRDSKNNEVAALAPTIESMVAIDEVVLALKESKAAHRILITDCCRDDATRSKQMRTKSFGTSIKTGDLPDQTVMLLSCSPGQTSVEHDDWQHGALTKCLLDEMQRMKQQGSFKTMGGLGEGLLPTVKALVNDKSQGKQEQTPKILSTGSVKLTLMADRVGKAVERPEQPQPPAGKAASIPKKDMDVLNKQADATKGNQNKIAQNAIKSLLAFAREPNDRDVKREYERAKQEVEMWGKKQQNRAPGPFSVKFKEVATELEQSLAK